MTVLTTETEFELPCGYLDAQGALHKSGRMRRATAADELQAARDPRVERNPSYLSVVVLARVVQSIGGVREVSVSTVESLFATDFAYLQQLYMQFNGYASPGHSAQCPACQHAFQVESPPLGGFEATP